MSEPPAPGRAPVGAAATPVSTRHRELLFSVVSTTLGSVADTDRLAGVGAHDGEEVAP